MSVSAAAEGGNGACGPAAAAGTAAAAPPKVRSYPDEPRVGVGVVILRQLQPEKESAEVLLIRRAKEPSKGARQWRRCRCCCLCSIAAFTHCSMLTFEATFLPEATVLLLGKPRAAENAAGCTETAPCLVLHRPLVLLRRQPGAGGDDDGVRCAGGAGGDGRGGAQLAQPRGPGLQVRHWAAEAQQVRGAGARAAGEALEAAGAAVRNRPGADHSALVYRCAQACMPPSRGPAPCTGSPPSLPCSPTLEWPVGVAAADALIRDAEGRLAYHYALVDYACVPEDPLQEPGDLLAAPPTSAASRARKTRCPRRLTHDALCFASSKHVVPSDDVDAAAWLPVTSLRSMHGLVPKVAEITEEAVRRHDLAAATKRP